MKFLNNNIIIIFKNMLLRRRRFDKTTPLATALPQKLTHHQSSFRETERKMSEDAKKNIAGALTARPNSDDQKLSPLPSPAPAVPPKKVIIKSADMIPDMQKEAVDIAVAVSFDNFLLFFCGSSFWILFLGLVVLAALCHKVLTILRIIQAFEKYNVEKDVAEQIKKEFDKRHGPTWHCIVGRNFGKSLFFFF